MQYRIFQQMDGKYRAQCRWMRFFPWDDLFRAGVYGIVTYLEYRFETLGDSHNTRSYKEIAECQEIIDDHKRLCNNSGEKIVKIIKL